MQFSLKKEVLMIHATTWMNLENMLSERCLSQKTTYGGTFKMVEEYNVELTFLSTNTSKVHLHVEQLLQSTY